MTSPQDVVFFVPGFLGFARPGNYRHFAERLSTALGTALESKLGRPVPVVPITSLPTRSLAGRQRALLSAISTRLIELGGAERVHLVGHGPGGVDAYLLSCCDPQEGTDWRAQGDVTDVRARIASVTTIASPHYGTCLAVAKGAGAFKLASLRRDREGAAEMARLMSHLVRSAWSDVERDDLWFGLLREGRKVSHFIAELRRWQRLIATTFRPNVMESLHMRTRPLPGIQRKSFVTLAARPAEGARGEQRADELFSELYKRTSALGGFDPQSPAIQATMDAVRAAVHDPARVIASPHVRPPSHVDAGSNDGFVNAARQLMNPRDPNELAAVVVADHFDVIGYYNRSTYLAGKRGQTREREVLSGLLHSGSQFRDDEFFALYCRVAQVIGESLAPVQADTATTPAEQQAKTKKRRKSTQPSA